MPAFSRCPKYLFCFSFYHCHCSQEIREIIPVNLRRIRTTRSSTHSHPFQVSLPNPRTLSHKSSFFPRTCNLWNVLPSSCFPESYNLPSFKSKIKKRDLIPLLLAFRFFLFSFVEAFYRPTWHVCLFGFAAHVCYCPNLVKKSIYRILIPLKV